MRTELVPERDAPLMPRSAALVDGSDAVGQDDGIVAGEALLVAYWIPPDGHIGQ